MKELKDEYIELSNIISQRTLVERTIESKPEYKAETHRLIKRKNDRNWKMDLDWLIANSTNYVKILEGKYS